MYAIRSYYGTYEQYRVHGKLEKVISGIQAIVKAKKELKSNTPHLIMQFLAVKPNEHEIPVITSYSIHYTKLYEQDPILKKMGAYRNNFTLRDSSLVTSLNRMAGDSSFLNPERSQVFSRKALNIARTIEFEDGECSSLLVIVITSYSIHYTKLYDI